MAINWNKNTVRWFRDASEYTGYNREMAKLILERIGSRGTLCDIGCGAAQIDFELAPCIGRITCVDLSQMAISGVDEEIRARGVKNITTVCVDATTLNERFDTVLMLFCGEDYFYEKCFPLATERMIFITHSLNHRDAKSKVFNAERAKRILDAAGAVYELEDYSLEYGQPFADLDDARLFFETYYMPVDNIEERLIKTGDEAFPYYLPKKKEFGIFTIESR